VQSQVRSASLIVLSIGGNDLYGDSIARVFARFRPRMRNVGNDAGSHVSWPEVRLRRRVLSDIPVRGRVRRALAHVREASAHVREASAHARPPATRVRGPRQA